MDLPALKYTIMVNGVTQLFMTKADVLNIFEEIKVCTHYKLPDGSTTDRMPFTINDGDVTPVYKTIKGWHTSLSNVHNFNEMPQELMDYIDFLEQELQVPITIVSTGPDRTQTLIKQEVAV